MSHSAIRWRGKCNAQMAVLWSSQSAVSLQVIAIDEAQFFPDLFQFCCTAANEDQKHVIVAGLDGDFKRQKFGQVLDLLMTGNHSRPRGMRCLQSPT